jgi:hypothetical protein
MLLNFFHQQWFLSQDHLTKNIIEARHGGPHSSFTWVEFAPQFHSYLIHLALHLIAQHFIKPDAQPAAGLVCKVKWVIFVYLLELLMEGPHNGFFNAPTDPHKRKVKTEHWCLAWKKTQASCKEKGQRISAGAAEISRPEHLVSNPDVPAPLKKCSQVSTPSKMSGIFFLAEEEMKLLDFKLWHSMITNKELEWLEVLDLEGRCRFFGLPFGLGADNDNALG